MLRSVAFLSIVASLLGTAVAVQGQGGKPYVQDEPRALTRVAYFSQAGLSGEYAIQYGKPEWKPEYDKDFDKLTKGKRVRLGKDFWTTLDTFCALSSGKQEIKPGSYFLALDCSDKGEWSLVLLDPESIRKQKVDAFGTAQTTGGDKIPLKHEEAKDNAQTLSIKFIQDDKDVRLQTLEIHFGKHRLTAPIQPKI